MKNEERLPDLSPLGFVCLAVACLTFGALYLNKVTVEAFPIMACWLFVGGVALVIVARGNHVADGYLRMLFLLFAAFFLLAPALGLALKYGLMKAG